MTEELTIGEVARRAGIRRSAIRYYESVGLLPVPARANGHRRYDHSILQRLAVVHLAQQAGFTVAEIQTLLHGFAADTPPAERWEALARRKLEEVDVLIQRAQRMKEVLELGLRCGCLRLEDCVLVDDERCGSMCPSPTSMEAGALITPGVSSSGASS
ncbi:MAG TPA: MerR family transcriptional regulator [Herpetosiphonaceae bacterium]|nr:MerR family transcriptional regulator [Herpetosiphonaceae bacterium]